MLDSGYWLKRFARYKPLEVHIFFDEHNSAAQAMLKFNYDQNGFMTVMVFEKSFETEHRVLAMQVQTFSVIPILDPTVQFRYGFSEFRQVNEGKMIYKSMDRYRSSICTRNPLGMDRTYLQSSNVDWTMRRLMKYTTMRFSAPGININNCGGCCRDSDELLSSKDCAAGLVSDGRGAHARRSELARRMR
ncbi:hypothetical protein QYF36_016284 [Acer negundo]|nr:hypothetical protein QYF36_016284 [Acer negundo]